MMIGIFGLLGCATRQAPLKPGPPPKPRTDAEWIPGYWEKVGDEKNWVPGHWKPFE